MPPSWDAVMLTPPPSCRSPKTSASPSPTWASTDDVDALGEAAPRCSPAPASQLDLRPSRLSRSATSVEVEDQLARADLVAAVHARRGGRHPDDLVVPAAARGRAGHADGGDQADQDQAAGPAEERADQEHHAADRDDERRVGGVGDAGAGEVDDAEHAEPSAARASVNQNRIGPRLRGCGEAAADVRLLDLLGRVRLGGCAGGPAATQPCWVWRLVRALGGRAAAGVVGYGRRGQRSCPLRSPNETTRSTTSGDDRQRPREAVAAHRVADQRQRGDHAGDRPARRCGCARRS